MHAHWNFTIQNLGRVAAVAAFAIALGLGPRIEAGTIPLQEAWTYDGPQPHGPGSDPLIDHQPHNFGGPASGTMAFEVPGGSVVAQYIADDFVLSSSNSVRRVVFWGFYNSQILPTSDETFQINFHAPRSSDGLPGQVLYSESFTNPVRQWTGRSVIAANAGLEYRFQVDLTTPLSVAAGDTTWLSIFQVGDPNTSFRWEQSVNNANGHAFNNQFVGDWTFVPWPQGGNNAFQLFSTPEPSSIAFLLVATIGLGCQSHRREPVR